MTKENTRLKNDNERPKRIINNDSTNSSLPPSTDKKSGKAANEFNHRTKLKNKQGGQKGHKGTTLTKESVQEKIKNGECNVHLERYLMKTLEESKNNWSKDMISFLSGINKAKKITCYLHIILQ